jgi:type VI secretion system protein ImpK
MSVPFDSSYFSDHVDHVDQDDQAFTDTSAPARPLPPLPPEVPLQERLAAVKAARNPLLDAAQPLLRVLADMPMELSAEEMETFHALLVREVTTFQSLGASAHLRHEHVIATSYALCTALDEAAHSTRWGGGGSQGEQGGDAGPWAARQLAAQFHGDTKGGDKVFLLVGRLAASPDEHVDLLEVLHRVLGLGFEGRFGAAANGRRQLESIRHRLLAMVVAARGEVPGELSANWRGARAGRLRAMRGVPVWVTASLLALCLVGLFIWYRQQLGHASADLAARIEAVAARRPVASAAVSMPALRLRQLLSREIARGLVAIEEDGAGSTLTFRGDEMFLPGQARLGARVLPVLDRVAGEIARVSGNVRVVGHSDNRPIGTREFPDNEVLSAKRATAVAQVLEAAGVAPSRVRVEGRADTQPLEDNATAAGRARNRRVDIVVTRGEATAEAPVDVRAHGSADVPARPPAHGSAARLSTR